jgi:hypothetical protein
MSRGFADFADGRHPNDRSMVLGCRRTRLGVLRKIDRRHPSHTLVETENRYEKVWRLAKGTKPKVEEVH